MPLGQLLLTERPHRSTKGLQHHPHFPVFACASSSPLPGNSQDKSRSFVPYFLTKAAGGTLEAGFILGCFSPDLQLFPGSTMAGVCCVLRGCFGGIATLTPLPTLFSELFGAGTGRSAPAALPLETKPPEGLISFPALVSGGYFCLQPCRAGQQTQEILCLPKRDANAAEKPPCSSLLAPCKAPRACAGRRLTRDAVPAIASLWAAFPGGMGV